MQHVRTYACACITMRSVAVHVTMVVSLCVHRTPQDRLTQPLPLVAQATRAGAAVEEVRTTYGTFLNKVKDVALSVE